ncbi:MAG: EF-hand domain-containing protein [Rhodomicrobiaceae bacterium]
MSKKLALGAGIAVLVISMSGVAIAKKHGKHCYHGGGHHPHHSMKKHGMNIMRHADADKDGNITKAELLSAHEKKFKDFDLNADGNVTAEEVQKKLSSHYEKIAKRITRKFDENRDGKVTTEEFSKHAEKKLYMLDLNDDGVISKDERPRKRMGWKRHHRPHHGKGDRGHHRGSHMENGKDKKTETQK